MPTARAGARSNRQPSRRRQCGGRRLAFIEPWSGVTGWSDQLCAGDMGGDPPWISCQQGTPGHGGVRADQEVGQNRFARTARLAIAGMRVAGEKGSGERDLLDHRH